MNSSNSIFSYVHVCTCAQYRIFQSTHNDFTSMVWRHKLSKGKRDWLLHNSDILSLPSGCYSGDQAPKCWGLPWNYNSPSTKGKWTTPFPQQPSRQKQCSGGVSSFSSRRAPDVSPCWETLDLHFPSFCLRFSKLLKFLPLNHTSLHRSSDSFVNNAIFVCSKYLNFSHIITVNLKML